jgi:hypothetical protein
MDQLDSRGERTTDLIAYFFEAYRSTTDKRFNTYIEMKINAYVDGEDIKVMDLKQSDQTNTRYLLTKRDGPSSPKKIIILSPLGRNWQNLPSQKAAHIPAIQMIVIAVKTIDQVPPTIIGVQTKTNHAG